MRWTYGNLGRIFISPAYHRIHHSATGRLDINLGTVFAIWDVLSRRAVFPAPDKDTDTVIETGLSGRPIPVEQAGPRPRLARIMLTQLAEPFISTRTKTLLIALVLLITRHLLVVLGAAALMAGTIVGFILAGTVGIFGSTSRSRPGWPGPC